MEVGGFGEEICSDEETKNQKLLKSAKDSETQTESPNTNEKASQKLIRLGKEFEKLMLKVNRNEVAIVMSEGLNTLRMRKILEGTRETNIQIEIFGPGGNKAKEKPQTSETALIKAGEKSYAKLLKKVKHHIWDYEEESWTEIMDIYTDPQNSTTTETEVMEELKRTTNQCQLIIKSLRAGKKDQLTATVEIHKENARILVRYEKIKIVWENCSVKERVDIIRCSNCLEHGHRSKECKGTISLRDTCLNCGATGHSPKKCGTESEG
ncbi:hypothetical protein JTB14_014242 [Gonioctena quinquepunctata]|nr:hypothetical protein JTB14_014242 [Gonioctena quinquepunctata]